jgi:hypothetical protein
MTGEQRFTGWELEAYIKRLLADAPPGKSYCLFCIAETLGITTAPGYVDITRALRRVGTSQPARYDTFEGKCVTHTGQRGAGTFWMIGKR